MCKKREALNNMMKEGEDFILFMEKMSGVVEGVLGTLYPARMSGLQQSDDKSRREPYEGTSILLPPFKKNSQSYV